MFFVEIFFVKLRVCAVEPRGERVPAQVRERSQTVRRDGAQAALPGEGDPEGRHSCAGHGGQPGGPHAEGDDRPGGAMLNIFSHFFFQFFFSTRGTNNLEAPMPREMIDLEVRCMLIYIYIFSILFFLHGGQP